MIIGDLGATTRGFLLAESPGLVAQTSCDHTNVSFLPSGQELTHSELAPKGLKLVTGCPALLTYIYYVTESQTVGALYNQTNI